MTPPGDALDRARKAEAAGDYAVAVVAYTEAYSALRAHGDDRLAALVAGRELSFLHAAVYGNGAAAQGWLGRARRLVAEAGDCAERGWVELAEALMTQSPEARDQHVRAAAEAADRFGDTDLRFVALAYEGLCQVVGGRVGDGMRSLDEAATAASAGEVRDYLSVGEIYCKMLLCCELTLDVRRAQHWMAVAAALETEAGSRWVPAICRMHYGGILTVAGRWEEADSELLGSINLYDAGYRAMRSGAVVRLADLRLRQGRYEEAGRLLAGHEHDSHAVRPLARLHLLRGEPDLAAAAVRRFRSAVGDDALQAPDLALVVEVELAAGRPDGAAVACRRLLTLAEQSDQPQLRGLAASCAGMLAAAAGESGASGHFEAAAVAFAEAGMPLERARAQLAIAEQVTITEPRLAVVEASAALRTFEALPARAEADAAAALLRRLGSLARGAPRRPGSLTTREAEVLHLVTEGLSNGEIATRLVVSKRTVEHHVGSILAKVGVQTRSQLIARMTAGDRPAVLGR